MNTAYYIQILKPGIPEITKEGESSFLKKATDREKIVVMHVTD